MPAHPEGPPSLDPAAIPRTEGELVGRVVLDGNGYVRVVFPGGSTVQAHVRGKLRAGVERPITGDYVVLDERASRVLRVLPRKSSLARTAIGGLSSAQLLAANVDIVFVVSSLDRDFSPRRLERFVATARDGGAMPVILLTKAAKADNPAQQVGEASEAAKGVDVHAIDVIAGIGGEIPASYLQSGLTGALVGSSGVGKSTLLNHLLGSGIARTGAVREGDDKGRHTTSHRELFPLPTGGFLIDTPGIRELGLYVDPSVLGEVFDDVAKVADDCRFRDCRHVDEPDCAVLEAVRSGGLDAARLTSFQTLREEAEARAARELEKERRLGERKGGGRGKRKR